MHQSLVLFSLDTFLSFLRRKERKVSQYSTSILIRTARLRLANDSSKKEKDANQKTL